VFEDAQVFLEASVVNEEGKLVSVGEEKNTALFPAEKLGKLEEVRYLMVRARVNTSEAGSKDVKVYAAYTLDFDLSMFARLRLNTREL
jgi:hypothetical protein